MDTPSVGTLSRLSVSYALHLQAERRKPETVKLYRRAIGTFLRICGDKPVAELTKDDIRYWMGVRSDEVTATSLNIEFRALKVFFRWLYEEQETKGFLMERIKTPKPNEVPPAVYSDDDINALLEACKKSRSRFDQLRDTAIILTLLDCGMRRSELIYIKLEDVDLVRQTILLRVTKNDRPRLVPIGSRTTKALDRYIRIRERSPRAFLEQLFIGQQGALTPSALGQMLHKRGIAAGLNGVRPHRFRHTWAHRSALAGMQLVDLMSIAGWKSVTMPVRYGQSAAQERAIAAHRKYSPVDLM